MTAARYTWMFRAAAVVYLVFGLSAIWRYAFTDYDPGHRPIGLLLGVVAAIVGVFLFRRARFAIVLSAIGAAVVAIAAAFAAPIMKGPVILALGLLAALLAVYATLAARALLTRRPETPVS